MMGKCQSRVDDACISTVDSSDIRSYEVVQDDKRVQGISSRRCGASSQVGLVKEER